MNAHSFRPAAVAAALLLIQPTMMPAQTDVLRPTVDFTPGLTGPQARVSWPALSGVRYRLRESPTLSPVRWSYRALVEAEGTTAAWLDPEPPASRDFYQVELPQAEVFQVSPPVLSTQGGMIYIYGQLIPPGSALMLEVEGGPPVFAQLAQIGAGVWRAAVVGGFLPGGAILSAAIVDGTGVPVCPIAQTFEITATGLASEGSPFLPHAAPVPDAASNPIPGVGVVIKRNPGPSSRAGNSALPGEVTLEQCDMMLAVPAGPRLAWVRTYRSKGHGGGGGGGGAAGRGWTHCYDVRIEPVPLAAGVNASRVYLIGGEGRRDLLIRQPDGSYRGDGMFREGRFNPDSSFTLTFADQGTWIFSPLGGAPSQGRLGSIVDRNGVGLSLAYNAAGQLATITSQFGQSLAVAYAPDGRVQSITDHTGRFVQYSYFPPGEPGGSPENLMSVSCPKLPGQSPVAGDTAYTYTTKFADDELNHNLLTVHDGAGRLLDEFTYSPESNPGSIEYDTCVSSRGHTKSGHVTLMKREIPPGPYPPRSYVCIENDPLGRVTECVFDAQHRCLSVRRFTGFATPGVEVTSTTNRPTGKLRSTDPDFYETTYLYNGQHLCTRVTEPDGTQHRITYDGDLRPDCPVRERANARLITLRAPNGQERTVTCEYKPGFGNLECAPGHKTAEDLAVRIIQDGNCEEAEFQDILIDMKDQSLKKYVEWSPKWQAQNIKYVGGGGKAQGVMGQKAKAWMVNNFEVHPVFGLKTEWITSIGLPKITPKISKESHGKFRLPLLNAIGGGDSIWDGGEDGGGCTPIDHFRRLPIRNIGSSGEDGVAINLRRLPIRNIGSSGQDGVEIKLRSIRAGHYAVSNFHTEIDGGGGGGGTAAVCGSPIGGLSIKGGKNPGGMVTRVLTSHGQVFTCDYDTHGNCISSRSPIAGGGRDWTYNALGQCTSSTVLNGAGSAFQTTVTYDATTHFCSSVIRDPAGLHLTASVDRDPLGRVTRLVDPRGFDWLCDYNPLDDVVQSSTPATGSPGTASRIATTYFYDAAGYLARCDVEHRDGSGALVAANPAYSTFHVYDERGQLVRVAKEDRPVNPPAVPPLLDPAPLGIENFAVRDFTLDDAGQCVRVSTPAACRGQATDAVCDYIYDERGLLYRGVSGGFGALTSVTTQMDYSTAGQPVRVTQVSSAGLESPTTTCTYDAFHRLASCTDPMGNVVTYQYAENGFVTTSFFGEPNDVPGSAGNIPLAECITKKMMGAPKIGEATAVYNISQGAVSGGGDPGGGARFDWRLLDIDRVYLCDMEVEDPVLTFGRFRPAFFDVFVADDVWTWRRFSQNEAPVNETTTIARSPAGLAQSITCNGDTLLTCAYDTAGRRVYRSDGSCAATDVLDEAGHIIANLRTDTATLPGVPAKSFSMTAAYDALGRRTSTSDASGSSVSQSYDSLGRPLSSTDSLGFTTVCRWESEDFSGGVPRVYTLVLEADVDGDGTYEVLSRVDCRSGECRSLTNSNGYETTLTRDALGRVTRRDYPDGTFETASFDALGRLHQWRCQDESLKSTTFDLNGRAQSMTWTLAPGSTAVPVASTAYQYDGLSRMVACDQGASHLAWSYDSLGNELSESQNGFTFTRTFSHRGRTGIVYPNGARFSEARNAHGELVSCSAVNAAGVPINPPVVTISYLGHSVLRSLQRNGVVTDHTYRGDGDSSVPGTGADFSFDACVRSVVTNSLGQVLADNTVNRDRNQRVVRSETAFTEGSSTDRPLRRKLFTLDRLGRVTRCITGYRAANGGQLVPESDVNYTLDLEGNRLSVTGGLHPGAYSLSTAIPPGDHQMNQYTSWPGGPLAWDDKGSLTGMTDGAVQTTLVYDACARLVAVNDALTGAPIATYGYDAQGRRTRSTVAGTGPGAPPVDTYLLYDGSVCLQEVNSNGEAEMSFITGGTGLRHCISTKNGTTYYPHGGGGGSALAKFDYPILSPIMTRLEPIEMEDPVLSLRAQPGGGGIVLTGYNGLAVERIDRDDAGSPIFLTSDGLVRPGATDTVSGYRWIEELARRWCPETGFFQGSGGVYSPQIGQGIAVHATTSSKKEFKGHVTLLK